MLVLTADRCLSVTYKARADSQLAKLSVKTVNRGEKLGLVSVQM